MNGINVITDDDGRIIEADGYRYDDLNDKQKSFVDGMYAMRGAFENASAGIEIDHDDEESILNKIYNEIARGIFEDIRECLQSEIENTIIAFGDENVCEDDDENDEQNRI